MPTDLLADIIRFCDRGETLTSLDDLTACLVDAVAGLGFRSISTNLISLPGRERAPGILFGQGGWSAWSNRYGRLSLARHDPALRMLRSQAGAFTWTEARRRFASPEAEAVMDACRDYTGLDDALVVPIRDADHALLSVTFAGDAADFDPTTRRALQLAGWTHALRGREILSGFHLEARCALSQRQLDCLTWVYRGKTDAEIATILGIAPRTAHNHIEAAKGMLGVCKRGQAAQEAWLRGWIN